LYLNQLGSICSELIHPLVCSNIVFEMFVNLLVLPSFDRSLNYEDALPQSGLSLKFTHCISEIPAVRHYLTNQFNMVLRATCTFTYWV